MLPYFVFVVALFRHRVPLLADSLGNLRTGNLRCLPVEIVAQSTNGWELKQVGYRKLAIQSLLQFGVDFHEEKRVTAEVKEVVDRKSTRLNSSHLGISY